MSTLEEKKEAAAAVGPTPVPEERTRRKPRSFDGTDTKLKVNGDRLLKAGYHLHIVNDMETRIPDLLDHGYEFVLSHEIDGVTTNVTSRNTDIGDKVRFLVGTQKTGDPLYAYLLKIKQEWYDEDMAKLQSRNDLIDDAIRKGKPNAAKGGMFYSKEGEIKLQT